MKVSIIYITGRHAPRLDWTIGDLAAQKIDGDEIDLIVVDALGRRDAELVPDLTRELLVNGFTLRVVAPKPNIWQGPFRVTSSDWWAVSNSRNTGVVLAHHDYLSFLDDRCRLGRDWLDTVRAGELARDRVIAGAYSKTEDGVTVRDHRHERFMAGKRACGGQWLYGCTLALPLAWALEVNGFEEGCDGLSMEDVIFGLNLEHAGKRIDFDPRLIVHQNRDVASRTPTYHRTDKGVSPRDKSHAALARFGTQRRTEMTPNLIELRAHVAAGGAWPIPDPAWPHRDWYDNSLISESTPP